MKRRGYLPPLIDTIIGKLKEQNYIDDASFAAQWTEQRIYSQKKGRQLIKQELKMTPSDFVTDVRMKHARLLGALAGEGEQTAHAATSCQGSLTSRGP